MKFVATVCVVGLLFLVCTNSAAADQQDDGSVPPELEAEDTCQNLDILMVSNSSTGIHVILMATEDANDSPPLINLMIAGRYLPPECRVNSHLCGILHLGHPNGTSHYIIPSIRGFVVLSLWADYNNRTDELPWKSFIEVKKNCNPTEAYLAGHNRIVVACMDLQSRPTGILYFMNYDLLLNSTGSGWTVVRNTVLPTRSEEIYSPATVSEIIHVREQVRCAQKDNLYVVDDAHVLRFPTSRTSDPEFVVSDSQLKNCIGYQSFEYDRGNDSLIIRCSNNRTARYHPCVTGKFTYQELDDHIPYPCTNRSTVAYRNGTQLTFNGTTQQLPSGDISFGKCIQGVDRPVFIASSADGSLFISRFDGNNVTKIVSSNCSDDDNLPCPARPVFSENEHVFGAFDSEAGRFVIANVTEGCTDDPVIAQIPIPFIPDLVSISLGRETYNCSCSAVPITEPSTTTEAPKATQTELTTMQTDNEANQGESTTDPNPSDSTYPTDSSYSNASQISTKGLLAGVIVTVLLIVLILTAITSVLVFLVYKFPCHNHTQKFSPTMQSQPESIQICVAESQHNPINKAVDNSGETTTTTSVSEFDEMASSTSGGSECVVPFHPESGQLNSEPCLDPISASVFGYNEVASSGLELECTVPSHAETGQPGGEACRYMISIDTYPLNCTQISPPQVCENLESRTKDNREHQDMDTKVQTFIAEHNNYES